MEDLYADMPPLEDAPFDIQAFDPHARPATKDQVRERFDYMRRLYSNTPDPEIQIHILRDARGGYGGLVHVHEAPRYHTADAVDVFY